MNNLFNKNVNGFQSLRAFTLAEILVTIGVIGIVVALTIPTLVSTYQDYQYKIAYKRAYSVATQALSEANRQGLMVSVTGEGDLLNQENFLAFMEQFKLARKCINNDNASCWNPSGDKYNVSYPYAPVYAFVDTSGCAWSMYWGRAGSLFVDVNGDKKPNRWGKDRFVFEPWNNTSNINAVGGITTKWMPKSDGTFYSDYYGTSWLFK